VSAKLQASKELVNTEKNIATCQNEQVMSVQLLLGVCQSSVWSEAG
jgi:hypothetical protein